MSLIICYTNLCETKVFLKKILRKYDIIDILQLNAPMNDKKQSMLMQVMKPKDWIMLFFLIVISIGCWFWVLNAYSQSFDYNTQLQTELDQLAS